MNRRYQILDASSERWHSRRGHKIIIRIRVRDHFVRIIGPCICRDISEKLNEGVRNAPETASSGSETVRASRLPRIAKMESAIRDDMSLEMTPTLRSSYLVLVVFRAVSVQAMFNDSSDLLDALCIDRLPLANLAIAAR